MDVRLARPTDAPLVFALAFDDGAHLVRGLDWPQAKRVARTLARATLPRALPARCWLARDGSTTGLLESHSRQYVMGWDVARLVVRGDPSVVVGPLIAAATDHLQGRGVPRLFARPQIEAAGELRRVGFQSLAREYVLVGPARHSSTQGALPVESRYRLPQDAWALHQLESDIAPSLVWQLEGLTSWEWTQRRTDMTQIVVERDAKIVAWVGWQARTRRRLIRLGLLVHPAHLDVTEPLLVYALQQLPAGSRYLIRLREYQTETLRACIDTGFEVVGEEILMVKHAGVELARAERSLLRVNRVPGVPAFRSQVADAPRRTASGAISYRRPA